MTRKKNNSIDRARQAIFKLGTSAVKENKRKVAKLSKEFQRTRNAALKQAQSLKDRETVAQWRALRKIGMIQTKAAPAKKNLTPAVRRNIAKSFLETQKQSAMFGSKVVRPLERTVIKRTLTTRAKNGAYVRRELQPQIKYDLSDKFKFVKSKNKPTSPEAGFRKTKKGYLFEVANPEEKVTITRKGKIKRTSTRQGFVVEAEGISGEQLFKLVEAIENGKFKIGRGRYMEVEAWDGHYRKPYDDLSLDMFAERFRRYESTMGTKTFEYFVDTMEVRIISRLPNGIM